jgi:hypothetical protein
MSEPSLGTTPIHPDKAGFGMAPKLRGTCVCTFCTALHCTARRAYHGPGSRLGRDRYQTSLTILFCQLGASRDPTRRHGSSVLATSISTYRASRGLTWICCRVLIGYRGLDQVKMVFMSLLQGVFHHAAFVLEIISWFLPL